MAMCGPTLIANTQCREAPDRGESCGGGWAKQHSTAVMTFVRRSGLEVIGWEFEMDMTLGPAWGKLLTRVEELLRHVGTAWKACFQADHMS